MQKSRLLFISFALVVILGGFHIVASTFYLYWTVWWFDNVMHFLGGLSIGLLSLWGAYMSGFLGREARGRFRILLTVVISVLVVGLGWEIFEYLFGISNPTLGETYMKDTIYDLSFDLIGAILVGLWGSRRRFYGITNNG
jgi:hypothetical protein